MKHRSLLLLLLFYVSCIEQTPFVRSRLETADKFIECLKNNTPAKTYELTYRGIDGIMDLESWDFYVTRASALIKKFGIPPKSKWIINYDTKNNYDRLLITIPLFSGYDSASILRKASIIIAFPPPEISDKVYRYQVEEQHDPSVEPLPLPADTTKPK